MISNSPVCGFQSPPVHCALVKQQLWPAHWDASRQVISVTLSVALYGLFWFQKGSALLTVAASGFSASMLDINQHIAVRSCEVCQKGCHEVHETEVPYGTRHQNRFHF